MLRQDVAYCLRTLRASPVFTAAAILALALGIGGNVAVFSLVEVLLLNPLSVREPSRLVVIQVVDRQNPGFTPISTDNFRDVRDQQDCFEQVAAFAFASVRLTTAGEPQELFAASVSGDYFDVLGVPAAVGQRIRPEHDTAPGMHPVAALGHRLWMRAFGGDARIVGQTIRLSDHPFTVIGVTPPWFRGTQTTFETDLYIPLSMYDTVSPGTPWFTGRRWRWLTVIARMRDGVTLDQANVSTSVIGDRLAQAYPEVNRGRTLTALPIVQATVNPNQHGTLTRGGAVLYGVVAIVLLIACVNLASLLLARSASRAREIALRTALGASRARIVQQLLTESLLIGLAGGAAGLVLAYWIRHWLWSSRPANFNRANLDLMLNTEVFLFGLALSVVAGLLFGIVPALQSSRTDVIATLKQAGRQPTSPGRQRVRSLLVVVEVALSVVALVAAGVLIRSLQQAQAIDPGFDSDRVLRLNYSVPVVGFSHEQRLQFHHRVRERLAAIPGVRAVAVADRAPLSPGGGNTINVAGQLPPSGALGFLVQMGWVSPGYFSAVGIPLIGGRGFENTDRDGSPPVAVINETMARRFWPDRSAIGERITSVAWQLPLKSSASFGIAST